MCTRGHSVVGSLTRCDLEAWGTISVLGRCYEGARRWEWRGSIGIGRSPLDVTRSCMPCPSELYTNGRLSRE